MVAPEEIDVSMLTMDELAEIEMEIPEHELTLFQKALCFVELVLMGWFIGWCFWAVIHNAGLVASALDKAFG